MYLPNYSFSKDTAEWTYRLESEISQKNWLSEISYSSGEIIFKNNNTFTSEESFDFETVFKEARETLLKCIKEYKFIYGKSNIDQKKMVDE
jgi:hypothetical protein